MLEFQLMNFLRFSYLGIRRFTVTDMFFVTRPHLNRLKIGIELIKEKITIS